MEVGIGHHGEPGVRVEPLKKAAEVAREMVKTVLDDHDLPSGAEVAVLISGPRRDADRTSFTSSTTRSTTKSARVGSTIARAYVGNFFTSLEMVGATLTIMALDDELQADACGRVGLPRAALRRLCVCKSSLIPESGDIVLAIAERIIENRAYLSEIDGLIGDGDHGVNMAKGFGIAAERLRGEAQPLSKALSVLGDVLMTEIGGSMGPLYGVMFSGFAEALDGVAEIDAAAFERMLRKGLAEVQSIGEAKVGDKTMIDAYSPALEAFSTSIADGKNFAAALDALAAASEKGRDSTVNLVAKNRARKSARRAIARGA